MRNIYPPGCKNKPIKVRMHRLILDCREGEFGDHINGDKLDNRRSNLRKATASQNAMNWSRKNKSGFRGVYWFEKDQKYMAKIKTPQGHHYLGMYSDILEAAEAYNNAAKIYHKEFAVLNKI